jgi:hypothetical protein
MQSKLSEGRPYHHSCNISSPSPSHTDCIQFNISYLGARDVSLSLPTNPPAIPGIVSIAASDVVPVATSVASEVQSAVSSATTSFETAVGSVIPQNCSLGIEYFCIGFTDRLDCGALPLTLSNIMPSSSGVQNLDRSLAEVTPRSIRGCLVTGAVFTTLAMFFSICSLSTHRVGLVSFQWILGRSTHLRSICSLICCIPLLALTVILYGLQLMAKLPMEVTLETGEASRQVLAALIFAVLMGVSTIFGWLLDRHSGILF